MTPFTLRPFDRLTAQGERSFPNVLSEESFSMLDGEADGEIGAFSLFAFDLDLPTMTLDNSVTDRKAKPHTLDLLLGRKKGFENLISALFRNPHPRVPDMDQDLILFSSCSNGKDSTLRHRLLGILKHIEHHLPQLVRRSHHFRNLLV